MIKTYLADPGFALTVRWALAVVFAIGLAHKLKAPTVFGATLANYRLLPGFLLTPATYLIIALEWVATAGLVLNSRYGSITAAVLLALYTLAISANLLRGRRDIDCGCSGPAIRETLSGWLVIRNTSLLAIALLTIPASAPRPLTLLDWFTAFVAVAVFFLLYSAAAYLSAVRLRYGHQL